MMKRFKEGDVEVYASEGEITKKLPVFYNPLMEFDRDLTVAVLKAWSKKTGAKDLSYCDLLAGSGIRAMRALKETGAVASAAINDKNPNAAKLIKKNLKLNGLTRKAKVSEEDADVLLRAHRCDKFDIVDIDPFGSFMCFLDSSLRAVSRKGLLFLTATDTAPLCGVSVNTCVRRYDSRPLKTGFCKEIGLRILIAAVVRNAARYFYAPKPLLAYNRRHYFRLYMENACGRKKADANMKNIGYLQYCYKCGWRGFVRVNEFKEECPVCSVKKLDWAGPLWTAEFADPKFCATVAAESQNDKVTELLETIAAEQAITLPYYDIHKLCEMRRMKTPRKSDIMERLHQKKAKASWTHFTKTGIRSSESPL